MINRFILIAVTLTIKLATIYAADNQIPTECPRVDPINTTIHIPHEFDCSKFYSCSNGRKILMMCPLMDGAGNRLHFNPKLQVCDWPNRAGCNGSSTTPTAPTETTSVGPDNSTAWVVTTEPTEAHNSSEVTEVIGESTEISTVTEAKPNSTVTSTTSASGANETGATSRPPGSTSTTTQEPSESSSTVQTSTATQSTVQETESTSRPSESTSSETETPEIISSTSTSRNPSEITTLSTESSIFLTSTIQAITNQTEISTTNQTEITTTNPTIITTDDFESNDTISTLPTPLPKCTSNVSGVLYPHESDCSLFYICDHGKLVLLSCAQGLYFDEPRQICVWPSETNCLKSTPSVSSTTSSVTTTTSASTNISDLCPTDNSKDRILYPHECSCSKFYICSNGQLVLKQCPEGLNFNSTLKVCDWPENVQCLSSAPIPSTTEPSTPTPSVPVETIKPLEPNSSESSSLIDQSTVSKSECPEDGSEPSLPHETNCRLYYECSEGKKWLKECPTGLEFNPTYQFCDRPEVAGCSNSGSNQGSTQSRTTPRNESDVFTLDDVSEKVTSFPESFTSSAIVSSTASSDKCLKPCPENDPVDYTVLVENENCSKFCKCSHGIPYVLNCPAGLEFNSLLQTCDYPDRANCPKKLAPALPA